MQDIASQFLAQFSQQSGLEIVAVLLALAYVWLAAKQNILCWPCAFGSTAIYTYLFWEVSLPFHTLLNAYYIAMAVYGWWQWNKPRANETQVVYWPYQRHLVCIATLIVLSLTLVFLAQSILDTQHLYLDAFITVFSVFTTVLVAHKVRENWLYWIVINSFAVYLYFANALYLTSALFVLYVFFAIYGYISWGRSNDSVIAETS